MRSRSPHPAPHADGFTLVEVMVAMVIGMIGIIIMMQVFATAEGQKRTTTGTGDAQSSGALALYELQGAIRQSGYGFNSTSVLNRSLEVGPIGTPRVLPTFAPTLINPAGIPAGDAGTDTLLIAFGSSPGSSEGDAIILANGLALSVQTPANFAVDDRVIVAPAIELLPCPDAEGHPCPSLLLDTVDTVAGSIVTLTAFATAQSGQLLFNLGGTPTIRAYAVRGGNLTACDYVQNDCGAAGSVADATIWVPIASNIVGLRAEYGWDTTLPIMDGSVDAWSATRPATLTNNNACQWVRAPAVRIALLARNSQVDKAVLTQTAPTWEGSANRPLLNPLTARSNWQNYRYKVFETVVPIRNLPWMSRCS